MGENLDKTIEQAINALLFLIARHQQAQPEAWRHAMIEAVKQLDTAANIVRKTPTVEKPATVATREES